MIIINSAAYVIPEFRNEFGLIPPSFLPIGNKKLLSFQIDALRQNFPSENKIILSLPAQFTPSLDDYKLMTSLNIEPVFVEEGISLGMALLYLLNTVEYDNNDTLRLLHGDTLLNTFPLEKDCIALARTQDDYAWEFESNAHNQLVWCGYFAFSSIRNFIRRLAKTQGDFTSAIHQYSKEIKCVSKEIEGWLDLGHINTYFRSRAAITTQRAFNDLKINNGVVWKSGTPPKKIEAEANWFQNLPVNLKRFAPQLIQSGLNDNKPFYETEYLPYLPLNEIFVHGENPPVFWENILGLISQYMNESQKVISITKDNLSKIHLDSISLYKDKTFERLESYSSLVGINLDIPTKYDGVEQPSLRDIATECIKATLSLPEVPSIVHGDLCLSNIMYDSRGNNIKVIDPRGMNTKQEFTLYGNQSYDLAKLCHSFIGLYDFIIADSFNIEKSTELGIKLTFNIDKRLEEIQELFMNKKLLPNINNNEIIPATILLFLSMIPLHFDKPNRQEAMLANALRLYVAWKEKTKSY
ncbi:phosphotransferase [Pasteurella multocida]|uniref:phosphotransferase n=1 Tax=Pasteurella multocida TaxID=747 RepID=UPI0020222BCA|nr:phosphotransferase [Pasteurella multocida]MCL7798879.1 aminoglycoside phosphotransferase family protein [Pasteurella multocida]MCL7805064.1 aminoglycoside phosphotransferase family protein [Pasteurella multocida]MCL7808322.1 aminoglycoside phosphotransferase family protein [Pasteurella multocida]MCL7809789.1 aminoglycoside phosphotransferase family protein [Pasteurella multocida]MCL7813262.1 aminoglycoside phosphotransferase family protein [Pasteurella multocida]